MNADRMDLLELIPERRYVALSQAEAAELGSSALGEWRVASPDGVHIDGRDYVELLRDGARWRRLARVGIWAGQFALVLAVIIVVVTVLGVVVGWLA